MVSIYRNRFKRLYLALQLRYFLVHTTNSIAGENLLQFANALVAQWIVQTRPKGTISVRFRTRAPKRLGLYPELGGEFLAVKADHNVASDDDDRHAQLARHLDHLLALSRVACHVVAGVLYPLFGKELLGHLAKVAGRRRVNGD